MPDQRLDWIDPTNGYADAVEVLYTDTADTAPDTLLTTVAVGAETYTVPEADAPEGRRFAVRGVNTTPDPDLAGPISNVVEVPVVDAGGGETVLAQDDFESPDGTPMEGRAPTWGGVAGTGGTWQRYAPGGGSGTARTYAGCFALNAAGGTVMYHQDELAVDNVAVEIEDETRTTDFVPYYVPVRLDTAAENYYRFYRTNTGWAVYKIVGGAQTAVGAEIADAAAMSATPNLYHLQVETVGGSVELRVVKDGTLLGTRTDSSSPLLGGATARRAALWNAGGINTGHRLHKYRILAL